MSQDRLVHGDRVYHSCGPFVDASKIGEGAEIDIYKYGLQELQR